MILAVSTVCFVVGNLTSLIIFLFPMKKIMRIWREGTNEESIMPFIASVLTVLALIVHGLETMNPWTVATNLAGLCVNFFYLIIIIKYRQRRYEFHFNFDGSAVTICFVFLVLYLVSSTWYAYMNHSDYFTLDSDAFPVAMTRFIYIVLTTNHAIKTGNLESVQVQLPVCLLTIVNGGIWFVRGQCERDWFIMVPNVLTVAAAALQVIVVVYAYIRPHRE